QTIQLQAVPEVFHERTSQGSRHFAHLQRCSPNLIGILKPAPSIKTIQPVQSASCINRIPNQPAALASGPRSTPFEYRGNAEGRQERDLRVHIDDGILG